MPAIPRVIGNRSLIFRLWFTLNIIFIAVAIAATSAYVVTAINDEIDAGHDEVRARQEMLTIFARIVRPVLETQGIYTFASPDFREMRSLGIREYDMFTPGGIPMVQIDFIDERIFFAQAYVSASGNSAQTRPEAYVVVPNLPIEPVDAAVFEETLATGQARRVLTVKDGTLGSATNVTPANILSGGSFVEENWYTDGTRILRTYIEYPNLTAEARGTIVKAALVMLAVFAATSLASWLLLQRLVHRPLVEYSRIATAIARGEPVRMHVEGRHEIAELATAVNGMADVLEGRASIDSLTGLFNLRHLSATLDSMGAESTRQGQPFSLLLVDLDRLKPINDTYGHAIGDVVLRTIGATLRHWAPEGAVCWRQGGDEFVIAMPGHTAIETRDAGEKLRRRVAALTFPVPDGYIRTAISLGVASLPKDAETASALLGIADRRMYEDKAIRRPDNLIPLTA